MNNSQNIKKVAVIGSGPAGYTACIYAARAGLDVTLYLGSMPGGQLTTTTEIENFPGFALGIMGPELMDQMEKQAVRFGTKVEFSEVKSVQKKDSCFVVFDGQKELVFDAIIIATGAKARYLGIEGEQDWVGKGYHTCATCDGFFYKNKVIAVVGGGDSAMEEATYLSKLASKVYLIHRSNEYKASKIMKERVDQNPKIEKVEFFGVQKFITEASNFKGVVLKSTKGEELLNLEVDGLFVAIGHIPNSSFVSNLELDQDELGYLVPQSQIAPEFRTSEYSTASKIAGIFIAGDIEDKVYRQAITAAAGGCKAAMEVEKYLEN
jgi:thioredoxin reductase (NADPH)